MDALEHYLSRATRGLWGRKKQLVRAELEGNIRELALEYQLQGLDQPQSYAQALRDFGDEWRLSRQLMEVHTMPTVYKLSLLGSVAAVALMVTASSAAPLQITSNAPLPPCSRVNPEAVVNAAFHCAFEGNWIRLSELRRELQAAGGDAQLVAEQLTLRFAGDRGPIRFSVTNPAPLEVAPGSMPDYVYHQFLSYTSGDETYLSVGFTVYNIVKQSALPVQLEGWQNPALRIGDTTISLGTSDAPYTGNSLYTIGLTEALRQALPGQASNAASSVASGPIFYDTAPERSATYLYELHRIQLKTAADRVYAIVSRDVTGAGAGGRYLFTTAHSADGILTTYLPSETVRFASNLNELTAPASKLEQRVAILELTGALNAEPFRLVMPAEASSQRIPR